MQKFSDALQSTTLPACAMSSQIERVVTELRGRILSGSLPAGHRVVELQFTKDLQVSRTPLRIALGELEKEGLLERLPTRGFRVRQFTLAQIADAVDVRGALEGMAARLAAERGLDLPTQSQLHVCLETGQALVDDAMRHGEGVHPLRWADLNQHFHGLVVQASGNLALAATLQFVSRIPMAGANALTLQGLVSPAPARANPCEPREPVERVQALELRFIQRAQQDHVDCVQALTRKEGSRAESIMREHAFRSRENKKVLIARLSRSPA